VEAWYSERDEYPSEYGEVGFRTNNGHFTQLVWRASTEIGVGIAASSSGEPVKTNEGECQMNNHYLVVDFNPAGNYDGEYAENVLPPLVETTAF
jgi:hypothetical protein